MRRAIPRLLALSSLRLQVKVPERMPLHKYDQFLSGANANFIEDLFDQWMEDPASVDPAWAQLFQSEQNLRRDEAMMNTPLRMVSGKGHDEVSAMSLRECGQLSWMIQAFSARGHLLATIDPLAFEEDPNSRIPSRELRKKISLDPEFFKFTAEDMDKVYQTGFLSGAGGLLDPQTPPMTLRQIEEKLKKTYCQNVGWEFIHIGNTKQTSWLRERIEAPERVTDSLACRPLSVSEQLSALNKLAHAQLLENYFHVKFPGQKRFGLDGGEGFIVGLQFLLDRAVDLGVDTVFMGMAHRGRLNVLTNICGKPVEAIMKEFLGLSSDDVKCSTAWGYGDVKYHLGYTKIHDYGTDKKLRISLLPNPSHLECVNCVVQGRTRAAQFFRGDTKGSNVIPIEIHGDAAFAGQGVTFETMAISEIGKYSTFGTIHLVINNQIGFTTDPKSSRSTPHCTDMGRIFNCPVFHVNGDSIEDVIRVFRMAIEYRMKFKESVVIDFVCYRRFGHNESDDPSFTQPVMYRKIRERRSVLNLFTSELVQKKSITLEEAEAMSKSVTEKFASAHKNCANFDMSALDFAEPSWTNIKRRTEVGTMLPTAISRDALTPVMLALKKLPDGFTLHPTLARIIERRNQSLESGENIEWGTAEALAFGTLLQDGFHIRVSGQDVERATFSQRHAVFHDINTDATYTQLANISTSQAPLTITNSPLSEFAVLGFEVGYALENPNALVMWEAQFGDFANGAQVIFDQFLFSGETKWKQLYNVVISLPHGYDGNGPEHSSCRLERFLSASNEDEDTIVAGGTIAHQRVNLEIVYPSTPAQYFHALRRQVLRDFRKPLVVVWSKANLRFPYISNLSEFLEGTSFKPVIGDGKVNPSKTRRVVFCQGQVYHALAAERESRQIEDVALVRIEQMSPFPFQEVADQLQRYPDAEIMWAQEEPRNMGSFSFVKPRIQRLDRDGLKRKLKYAGRNVSASPATGYKKVHDQENKQIMKDALE